MFNGFCTQAKHKEVYFRFQFKTLLILSGGLLLQSMPVQGEKSVLSGPDADAIVHKMVSTYQSAQSVQEKSEAKMQTLDGKDFYQTSDIKFRRPNLLNIVSTDPKIGTYSVFCNGKTITMYTGTQNIYTVRDSPTNLRQTVQSLYGTGLDLLGVPVMQSLSPVSFISAKVMPDECKKFRYVKEDIVDGKRVYVVKGQADFNWVLSLMPTKEVTLQRRDITLWIDVNRFLLLKASCDIIYSFATPVKPGQQPHMFTSNIKFIETHRDIVLNIPIREESFFFQLPKGAVEKFQERR